MQLIYSPTSPYARKTRAVVIEKNLQDQVEFLNLSPGDNPKALLDANALNRIPTLIRDDGKPLIDSPFICEYLDSLGADAGRLTGHGDAVWEIRHLHAFADGIIDSIFAIAMERRRDAGEQSPAYIQKQLERIGRGLNTLNGQAAGFSSEPDLGQFAVGCTLGYMDIRLQNDLDWRATCPNLATWYAAFSKRPAMAETAPPAP
ncbi:MAG: glutathione S-transferase N-terminal domain-containing protein [Rhodospirillales bacterium]|nr:glutathione S-transferase N-terminal domain-containing protein [Rhodospirillales bacterium]